MMNIMTMTLKWEIVAWLYDVKFVVYNNSLDKEDFIGGFEKFDSF